MKKSIVLLAVLALLAGGGKFHVETHLALPSPCIAPVVFVTSTGSAWFAATGH